MKRVKKLITYHGRKGHPLVHLTLLGLKYIMVRKKGGGLKRLYEGSKYFTDAKRSISKRLKLN